MSIREAPLKRVFKELPRYEPVAMDHSSLIVAKLCLRKYFFRIVLGFIPRETMPFFTFGSAYHKFREILEIEWKKAPLVDNNAMMEMCQVALTAAHEVMKKRAWVDPQVGSKWDFLTRARLTKSCLEAFKHWMQEKKSGRVEVVTVEQNFILPIPDTDYHISGKADQIIRWNTKLWGKDFKTSSKTQDHYFQRTLDPNHQFTLYTWAEKELSGEEVSGQIIEVLFNAKGTKSEPEKGPKIHTHLASRSQYQLDQWLEGTIHFLGILDRCREFDIYPMEENHCPYCEYHSVCKSSSERMTMSKLESEFKVEPWDPTNRDTD